MLEYNDVWRIRGSRLLNQVLILYFNVLCDIGALPEASFSQCLCQIQLPNLIGCD
jgi:hypothetical protein